MCFNHIYRYCIQLLLTVLRELLPVNGSEPVTVAVLCGLGPERLRPGRRRRAGSIGLSVGNLPILCLMLCSGSWSC